MVHLLYSSVSPSAPFLEREGGKLSLGIFCGLIVSYVVIRHSILSCGMYKYLATPTSNPKKNINAVGTCGEESFQRVIKVGAWK